MESGLLARRYAKVLFELASESDRQTSFREEFAKIGAVIMELPDLALYLSDKKIPASTRQEAITSIAKDLSICTLFENFLHILVQRGRFSMIDKIAQEYSYLVDESDGIVHVSITSPIPLTEQQRTKLEAKLRKLTNGKPVIHETVDPELMIGLKIEVNNTIYDGSLSTKLEYLREKMTES